MARVTVEDCLAHVENRFELVLVAAKRARQLISGKADALVNWEHDKATVVALRELASGSIDKATIETIEKQPMHQVTYYQEEPLLED